MSCKPADGLVLNVSLLDFGELLVPSFVMQVDLNYFVCGIYLNRFLVLNMNFDSVQMSNSGFCNVKHLLPLALFFCSVFMTFAG